VYTFCEPDRGKHGIERAKHLNPRENILKQDQARASKREDDGGILTSFVISGSAVQIRPWAP
jgi:hypothetical protein